MSPLLIVIVTFGLIFVVTASLAQGIGGDPKALRPQLRAHPQLNVMLLISNFIVMPAILVGIAALTSFNDQVKMAIVVLAVSAGAPFIPWLVSIGKGNLAYSAAATSLLLVATLIVVPLVVPPLCRALDVGFDPSVWLLLWPMLLFIVLPLLVGIVIRARYPVLVPQIAPWLGPISLTFLVVHVSLFIGYSWSEFLSLAGDGQIAFTLAFPAAGLLIGYLLSPPYVLSPLPAANPHRGSKIVSAVAVAQQNTSAVICCAIFAFGDYVVAGDYMLLGAIVTIVVVTAAMLELGRSFEREHPAPAAAQAGAVGNATPTLAAPVPVAAPSAAPPQMPQGDR